MKHETIIKVGVLIEKNGKLLLIKEKTWQDKQYYWNIIKGTFEPKKDKTLFDAAQREAKEETNTQIKIKNLLNILYLEKNNKSFFQFNFVATLTKSYFSLSSKKDQMKYRKGEEIIDVRFFTKKDLKKMKKKEFIGERTYHTIQDWLKGKKHSMEIVKTLQDY